MQELPEYSPNRNLSSQLRFLVEIDKIKGIVRKSRLFDGTRFENDAEHSWTICIMAVLLREYSNLNVNIEKVLEMLLIHDIVEIDAGDTFLYSPERQNVYQKEKLAAERIFGLLETDQREEFISLWEEFEERTTNESKFASVFDRLEPIIQNYMNEGYTWKQNNVTLEMVIPKNRHIEEGSKEIWNLVLFILHDSVKRGFLKTENENLTKT